MSKVAEPDGAHRIRYYAALMPVLHDTARKHGYAIAVHGTLQRDLDIVAVPWVDDASAAEVLVEAIRTAVGQLVVGERAPSSMDELPPPTRKPHGRMAWCITLGCCLFIDLSVMPLLDAAKGGA